jgi:hypothetical protein
MSTEEQRKVLQMVENGKVTAEEAAVLMQALDESAEGETESIEIESGSRSAGADAADFDQVRERAWNFAAIPLWVGVIFTVLSSWGMFAILRDAGLNFWFFFMSIPLALGVLLIVVGAGDGSARWLYVDVDRSNRADWPKNITIALPLPLGLASWFLKNFGMYIEGLKQTTIDEMIMAVSEIKLVTEPLVVNVDDHAGERVQVFIA